MFPKDDVYTIPLPGSNLVFTRYLYIKDEVKIAFLIWLTACTKGAWVSIEWE